LNTFSDTAERLERVAPGQRRRAYVARRFVRLQWNLPCRRWYAGPSLHGSHKLRTQAGTNMVRIEVDAETAKRLAELNEPIEIFGVDGERIGYFSRPIFSDEIAEARRLAALPRSSSTLDEVWNRIRSRSEAE
jgi:hypothetical protein